ncbi:MAG: hypothetical protein RSE97_05365, partial [Oscillospiraceae bacterium]
AARKFFPTGKGRLDGGRGACAYKARRQVKVKGTGACAHRARSFRARLRACAYKARRIGQGQGLAPQRRGVLGRGLAPQRRGFTIIIF